MKQWFEIDPTTRRVRGWVRSSKAKALPENRPDAEFVECSDADRSELERLQAEAIADGRDDGVIHDGGLSLPADNRPRARIEVDKTQLAVDGTVTLTITALRQDGEVRTGLNTSVLYEVHGRVIKLDFENGVATKTLRMPQSGRFRFGGTRLVKVESPVEVVVVE